MKLKAALITLVLIIIGAGFSACQPTADRETIMQVSTIDAVMNGVYDGVMTIGELKDYGDFGIGTLARLDGEMVELDGQFYQIKADGKAYTVTDNATTPFASVTFFDNDRQMQIAKPTTYLELQQQITGSLPTPNIFYAIKITGTFSYMKTRSVPAQNKPYPPLVEVTKNQPIFEFNDVTGTIVGFFTPTYANGINVAGFHLHFLNEATTAGGHVLDFTIKNATVAIDDTADFKMMLPGPDSDFYKLNLTIDTSGDIQKAEK